MTETAGLWQRVSTGGQDEASQLPDLIRWCESHGYEVGPRYVVHGQSAYHGKQAQWIDQAMEDMAAGKINVLVVWSADRIERRGALAALMLADRARQAGGRIEYVKDAHLNATNDMSDVMLSLSATMARQESKRKGERITAKHAALRSNGSVVGRAPWGYEIAQQDGRKVLVPTSDGRNYVPAIYQKVIDGESLRSIAAWLTREGVKTQTGLYVWNEGFIGNRLIKNTVYMGQRRNGGQLETEALVSPTTWQQANAALASRVKVGRGTTKAEKAFVSPVCGACFADDYRSPMYRIFTGPKSNRRAYYRCTGRGPQRKGCGAPLIPADELDGAVREAMLSNQQPHVEHVFVAGDDRADEIARLRERGAEAMRKGDYVVVSDMMKQADELEAQPAIRPHWEDVTTDITEAEHFASLSAEEQRDYLTRFEISAHRHDDGHVIVTLAPRELI